MTKDETKDFLVSVIESRQGLKATELVAAVAADTSVENKFVFDFSLLEELVVEDRIVEIEYVLPSIPYRIKSFYLPKNTEIKVRPGNR